MTSRRTIRGVLHNFLGTYTSRYSDFDGYWIFGFLVEDIGELRIDLMEDSSEPNEKTPLAAARRIAITRFAEQVEKAGLPKSCIREAYLDITKLPNPVLGYVNGWLSYGYHVKFVAKAVADSGKMFERKLSAFIAPHNPTVENRNYGIKEVTTILNKVINVQVTFLNYQEGGRLKMPVLLGYRPHFVVQPGAEMLGIEFTEGPTDYQPGEDVRATVKCLYPLVSYIVLTVGTSFKIVEGGKIVGNGVVIKSK